MERLKDCHTRRSFILKRCPISCCCCPKPKRKKNGHGITFLLFARHHHQLLVKWIEQNGTQTALEMTQTVFFRVYMYVTKNGSRFTKIVTGKNMLCDLFCPLSHLLPLVAVWRFTKGFTDSFFPSLTFARFSMINGWCGAIATHTKANDASKRPARSSAVSLVVLLAVVVMMPCWTNELWPVIYYMIMSLMAQYDIIGWLFNFILYSNR